MRILQRTLAGAVTLATASAVLVGTGAPVNAASLPSVGECFDITYAQIEPTPWDETTLPVPCSGAHTVEIFAAGAIPVRAQAKGGRTFRNSACTNALMLKYAGLPGGSVIESPLALGNYSFTYAGGTQYVCAVGIMDYPKAGVSGVRTIDGPLDVFLSDNSGSPDLGQCRRGTEKQWRAHRLASVNCNQKHQWRVSALVYLGNSSSSSFPGETAIKNKLGRACSGRYYSYFPTASNWKSFRGPWYGTCMTKTAY